MGRKRTKRPGADRGVAKGGGGGHRSGVDGAEGKSRVADRGEVQGPPAWRGDHTSEDRSRAERASHGGGGPARREECTTVRGAWRE